MDWKKITSKFTPYINKAKEYGKKVVEFTEDQIQTTPIFIKTQKDYEEFLTEKRSILIGYDEKNETIADAIRLHSSVWIAKAFMDAASLKFVTIGEYPELVHHIGLKGPLDMRIRYEGEQTFQYSKLEEVLTWWNKPCYTEKKPEPTEKKDPLTTL